MRMYPNYEYYTNGIRKYNESDMLVFFDKIDYSMVTKQSWNNIIWPLTVMQLSKASLTTSYSTSFQPFRDLSTNTWLVWAKAAVANVSSCSLLSANPDPSPPKANAALTKTGYPSRSAACTTYNTSNQMFLNEFFFLLNLKYMNIMWIWMFIKVDRV